MKDAIDTDRKTIVAGPTAPKVATCPDCGGTVTLRRRRNGQSTPTWFYRHKDGEGPGCSRRTSWNR